MFLPSRAHGIISFCKIGAKSKVSNSLLKQPVLIAVRCIAFRYEIVPTHNTALAQWT